MDIICFGLTDDTADPHVGDQFGQTSTRVDSTSVGTPFLHPVLVPTSSTLPTPFQPTVVTIFSLARLGAGLLLTPSFHLYVTCAQFSTKDRCAL